MNFKNLSTEVKVALIGGIALVCGAFIQAIFAPLSQSIFKSEEKQDNPIIKNENINNNNVTVPVNIYPEKSSQEHINELERKAEAAHNAANLAAERAARAEEQAQKAQDELAEIEDGKDEPINNYSTPKYNSFSYGDCCVVRLSGGEDRIMFRTRPLSSSEVAAVNREHGSVAQESEIANGLYNGQRVTFLGKEGKFYKIKAYIREEGRYRTGYFSAALFGINTLVAC